MTTFPNSPCLIKGGIVFIDQETSAVQLELDIEELVLQGFAQGSRAQVAKAVYGELRL